MNEVTDVRARLWLEAVWLQVVFDQIAADRTERNTA